MSFRGQTHVLQSASSFFNPVTFCEATLKDSQQSHRKLRTSSLQIIHHSIFYITYRNKGVWSIILYLKYVFLNTLFMLQCSVMPTWSFHSAVKAVKQMYKVFIGNINFLKKLQDNRIASYKLLIYTYIGLRLIGFLMINWIWVNYY